MPATGAHHPNRRPRPPPWPSSPRTTSSRCGTSPNRPTPSFVGPSTTAGDTSPPWSNPSYWSRTFAHSSGSSAKHQPTETGPNPPDQTEVSDGEMQGRSHEPLLASVGAEVVGLPLVVLASRGRSRLDLHATHGVLYGRHYARLPSVVLPGITLNGIMAASTWLRACW